MKKKPKKKAPAKTSAPPPPPEPPAPKPKKPRKRYTRVRDRREWEPTTSEDVKLIDDVNRAIHSHDYREFWPLTVRQIFYALMGELLIENTPKEYQRLVKRLAAGRIAGLIPWGAVHDNHRTTHYGGGFDDADSFIDGEFDRFLKGYHRCLSEGQPQAIEVWVEKDALNTVVGPVVEEYSLALVIAKGYSSVSYVHEMRQRINRNRDEGRHTKIIYFGDMDPSGVNMLPAMFKTLYTELEVRPRDASYVRAALNMDQITSLRLPQAPNALKDDAWQEDQRRRGLSDKKKGDPRAEAYKQQFGRVAVELDALKPRQLQAIARVAIEKEMDMDLYRSLQRQEVNDCKRIDGLRGRLEKSLAKLRKEDK